MKSVQEIKEELRVCSEEDCLVLCRMYESDERAGVQQAVRQARKHLEALEKERDRLRRMREYEELYGVQGVVCGIDEVGRGPLAGPVVAGAVILSPETEILYLNDSKKLTAAKREELSKIIQEKALCFALGVVDHKRIDDINILQATYEAMRAAVGKLDPSPDVLLNDAVTIPGLPQKQVPIVKGDQKSVSIAAASIVAKVARDQMMVEFDRIYPGYGFASNKGYGTADHIRALKELGPCPIHRLSFIKGLI